MPAGISCRFRSQRGQAYVELVMVLFLFMLFVTGITQIVMLGKTQIKIQEAARRASWLRNTLNHAPLQDRQVQAILPGCSIDDRVSGYNKEEGITVEVSYTVPAVGFFKLFKPQGFQVRARSAVVAYIQKPLSPNELMSKAAELLRKWF